MKKLGFKPDKEREFACLWEGFMLADQRIQSHKLRMFNRIVDKLESVSKGNPEAIEEVAKMLSSRKGQTLISSWVVNRKLTVDEEVVLEFEDEDFAYIKERIISAGWNPSSTKAAANLIDMLEKAEKGDDS